MRTRRDEEKTETAEVTPIASLTNDYGRTDLNEMRDKINEIVARVG